MSNYSTKRSTVASRCITNPLKKISNFDIENLGSYKETVKFGDTASNFTIKCKRENQKGSPSKNPGPGHYF